MAQQGLHTFSTQPSIFLLVTIWHLVTNPTHPITHATFKSSLRRHTTNMNTPNSSNPPPYSSDHRSPGIPRTSEDSLPVYTPGRAPVRAGWRSLALGDLIVRPEIYMPVLKRKLGISS